MNNEVFDQLKEKAETAEAIGGTLKFEVGDLIVYVDGSGNSNIVSQENEPIKALADGIVIMASWTLDGGYVLVIQHSGNLISIYKHNSELLKSVGNFVGSGEVVSIIGNTGELTSGPHLHFELWFKEQAVNPEDYINFR